MASQYSQSLKITLMGDGDQAGLWGQTTNINLGTLLEQAITGVQSIVMTDANYTLTSFNGVSDEARNAVLVVTGTNNAVRDLIPPVVEKLYTVVNNTTGGYAIRVIGASGTGVNIPNGATCLVYCDGTNFVNGLSGSAGNFSVAGNITATGNASVTGNVVVTGAITGNGVGISAINASNISSGTVATARLGSGTANAATFLRGDQTYALPTVTAVNAANFTIQQLGTSLVFQYNGANVAVMDSGGNLTSAGQFVAGGSV
ncbi:MAG: hypothetical protein EBU08_14530 [Micrococcales bacterium]|nr:hypothetical protein [Micrococcales bacterium]